MKQCSSRSILSTGLMVIKWDEERSCGGGGRLVKLLSVAKCRRLKAICLVWSGEKMQCCFYLDVCLSSCIHILHAQWSDDHLEGVRCLFYHVSLSQVVRLLSTHLFPVSPPTNPSIRKGFHYEQK